ncbi:vWA domain-containing protein [Caldalkalibacillus mannanilyticus]|uniref:vWA domain-containing protein n=1 Tax=Caldalkalibacillus mannanilyticus TaxID=1418 RepID=UPI00046AE2FF|nr:VWA domain-containing protein [Caldalkalibacillus mannanilyticus]
MEWLALHNLWLSGIIPAIIAMYLLKRKYEQKEISSTLLWEQIVRNQDVNRPWQRLQRNLLLFLQLLVAFLLVLAVLKPALQTEGGIARHNIVVLDTSGSMMALEGEQTRFELAKQEIIDIVKKKGSNQTVTLIEVGHEPVLHLSMSSDSSEILQALEQVEVRPGSGDERAAFSLAKAIASSDPESGIIWVGDGAMNPLSAYPDMLVLNVPFKHVQVGETKENIALAVFLTQEREGNTEGLIRLDNLGVEAQEGTLKIYTEENSLVEMTSFSVPAGESYTYLIEALPEARSYQAVIEVEDALSADNQLWSVPFVQGRTQAAVVAEEPSHFLLQSLKLGERLELEMMKSPPIDQPEKDVWVFQGSMPETLPDGNILWIAPQESTSWLEIEETVEFDGLGKRVEEHPILQHVDWTNVHIAQARKIKPAAGIKSVVQIGEVDLVLAGEIQGRRIVILNFDLQHSDFPLRPAFPIFIQNVITWLTPMQSLPIEMGYAGEWIDLPFSVGAEQRFLIFPDGKKEELVVEGTMKPYQLPEQMGLFLIEEIRSNTKEVRPFVVGMRDSQSSITPHELVVYSSEQVKEEESVEKTNSPLETVPIAIWFALAALLISFIEWGVYHRGY